MLPIHKIHAGRRDGFDIRFEFHPEETHPADSFDDGHDVRQYIYEIETGQLEWFWVECIASLNEVDLGTDSLGGCLYPSFEQFVIDNDYAQDMIDQAVTQARQAVEDILEKISA